MFISRQFGKPVSPASPSTPKVSNSTKAIQPKLPEFETPEEKALDNAKTRRLNAAAYKDQALGRLAYLESMKPKSRKVREKPKNSPKK